MKYSKNIELKYQGYILRKYNVVISDTEAQLNLENLSSLYLAFTNSDGEHAQKQSLK